MPPPQALYDWEQPVQETFANLQPHHCKSLAYYSFGMAATRCCGLTRVVTYMAPLLGIVALTLVTRLRELYLDAADQKGSARSEFDFTLGFAPLLRWVAGSNSDKQLVLALDPTCLTDRFRVLVVAVLYRGFVIPVAWVVQEADEKGSWNDICKTLLTQLAAELGEGWNVSVLTDRGLESAELFRFIVSLRWHPLMRVKKGGKFKPTGWHRGYKMGQFAKEVGRKWAGEGVAYPTGEKLSCTLLACWEEGHDEEWLILTDLGANVANPAWYAWRMWIEQGFRAMKRGCWQWQRTQMTDTKRAARLWAVMTLATLWMVEIGGEGEPSEGPKVPRRLSLLQQGLARLFFILLNRQSLPNKIDLIHDAWPKDRGELDCLTETMMDIS